MAFPPTHAHVLKLPFRFVLPSLLPPSCESSPPNHSAVVAYSIEVVGLRSGLHLNKRITQSLSILPHNALGAQLRDTLRLGWAGETRSIGFSKKVRKGIWGDYADVLVNVSAKFISWTGAF